MANETTYATQSNAMLAEAMAGEYLLAAAAREALPAHPVFARKFSINMAGSDTLSVPILGLDGYDALGAPGGEATAIANTVLTDTNATITVARYSKSYAPTDLARIADAHGYLSAARLAQDAFVSHQTKLVDLVAGLASGFANSVGSSGVDATVSNFLAAKRQLAVSNATGRYIAILHPVQWADIMDDLSLNSGGAIQFNPAAPELLNVLGNGYQGQLAGVDVFTTTRVALDGGSANRVGAMLAPGAVVWATGTPPISDPGKQVVIGDGALFEYERQAAESVTKFVTHYFVGVAEGIDTMGVGIVTDA